MREDGAQESFTDTDSRIMKQSNGGYDFAYNAQAAVDETAHIIVAAELTNNAADRDRLPVLLEAVNANLKQLPDQIRADAGFRSEAVFAQLKTSSVDIVVALGREGKKQLAIDPKKYPCTTAMAAKMTTPGAEAAYRKRKWVAEPPNGWIKNVLGFRQFSLRGMTKVRAEWKLICAALTCIFHGDAFESGWISE